MWMDKWMYLPFRFLQSASSDILNTNIQYHLQWAVPSEPFSGYNRYHWLNDRDAYGAPLYSEGFVEVSYNVSSALCHSKTFPVPPSLQKTLLKLSLVPALHFMVLEENSRMSVHIHSSSLPYSAQPKSFVNESKYSPTPSDVILMLLQAGI